MSYVTGRVVAPPLLLCIGFLLAIFGFVFGYVFPFEDYFVNLLGNGLLLLGFAMIIAGLGLYPGARQESKRIRSILELVAVRKEVTISDVSAETGLDREYVRKVITDMLIAHTLFGYLEDELFVRDTSGRPLFYGAGRTGLYQPSG